MANNSLDLVFLQDLSTSFDDDIAKVKGLIPELAAAVRNIEPDTRFGFASFVDKPISVRTDGYVYQTDLKLTKDISQLQFIVSNLRTYDFGNTDIPEAQLEGLLQAGLRMQSGVRADDLGFRLGAKRIVVLLTDAPFKKAGDGRTQGFSVPNDADRNIEPQEDYPSIEQVKEVLKNGNIIPIFAVTSDQLQTYNNLLKELGLGAGAVVELERNSSNLVQAISKGLGEVINDIGTSINALIDDTLSTARDLSVLKGVQSIKDFIGGFDTNDFYRFELVTDSSFELLLNRLSQSASVTLIDSSGLSISSATASNSSDGKFKFDLSTGTYYIQINRAKPEVTSYNLEIAATPKILPLEIDGVTPNKGSNVGQTTISIKGVSFTPDTKVSIIDSNGNLVTAQFITFLNDGNLTASFNLTGLTPGAYDVRASNKAGTATVSDIFTVNNGSPGKLEVFVSAPGAVRPWNTEEVLVTYRNSGNTDIPAPLLNLSADGALLEAEAEFKDGSVQFLGINNQGNAGILTPGASGTFRVRFKPKDGATDINFKVNTLSTSEAINWSANKDSLRPPSIPADAWNNIFNNFTSVVGNSTGDFQAVLNENATRLSQLGEYTGEVARLLAFELLQAGSKTLSERFRLGAFGRGSFNPWDITATTDSNGDVTVLDSDSFRLFLKQQDGTYNSIDAEGAILIKAGDIYQLREQGGVNLTFRPDGKLNFIEDPNQNKITAEYTNNKLTNLIGSNNEKITFDYNNQGLVRKVTNQFGQETTYNYDATLERLESVVDVNGTLRYTYETGSVKENAIKSITLPDNTQIVFESDTQGRLIKQNLNGGAETFTYSYDSAGGVTVTDANGNTTKSLLNDKNQVAQTQDANGRITQFRYDDNGNLTRIIAPGNNISAYTYDSQGNLLSSIDPSGKRINFSYDPKFDKLQTVRDQRGNTIQYSYSNKGNLSGATYPDNSSQTFDYNDKGELSISINRRGQQIKYTYDNQGFLTKKELADGTIATFDYDNRGNLIKATDSDSSVTYDYDSSNRLEKVTYGNNRSLKFTYDAGGRRSKLEDQDGFTTNYIYDEVGRLKQLTDKNQANIITYSYDKLGRLSREENGNGTYTTYSYDTASQLTDLVNYKADNIVNSKFEYTYDDLGRRTSFTTVEGKTAYGYDASSQLISVKLPNQRVIEYSYDAAGNRILVADSGTTTVYQTNNLNQYENVGDATYKYDFDGSLISKTQSGKTTSFIYDVENRLVRAVTPDGIWNYEYDAFGNRIASSKDGLRTEYLLDPIGLVNVIGEYRDGQLAANYTHGLGLASRVDTSNTASYYDSDAIGSIIGLTDTGSNYLNRYNYLPFGEDLTKTEAIANPFEYVGQWGVMDEGNGLDFMRARFYDSGTGRFNSQDPIGLAGGSSNLYSYVSNQPSTFIDPEGTVITLPFILAGSAIGAIANTGAYFIGEGIFGDGNITWGGVAGAALEGTIQGGVIAGTGGLSLLANSALGFGTGGLNEFVKQAIDDGFNNIKWDGVLENAALGAIPFEIFEGSAAKPKKWGFGAPQFKNTFLERNKHGKYLWDELVNSGLNGQFYEQTYNNLKKLLEEIASIFAASTDTQVRTSFDPNDIIGPAGFGAERWLVPNQTLPYTIRFENLATATAPAVFVTITQQLDSDFDFSTFELGDLGFGNITVKVPEDRKFHVERLDLRDKIGYFVDVEGGINPTTGELKWTLKAIDPSTGELPANVNAGFLPPNNANRDGEGYVRYRIKPKTTVTSGASLDAKAKIVFDTNAPIDTPVWLNRIDDSAPTSNVIALPVTTNNNNIKVSWNGNDDGSGVVNYDVFISVDSGNFTLWQDNITAKEAIYTGEIGRTYSFYSQATDGVNRIEAKTAISEASTKLVPGNTNPTLKKISDSIFQLEGEKSKLQVSLIGGNINRVNELGVFVVDDEFGTVNGIKPGADGYTQAALNRAKALLSTISNFPNGFNQKDLSRLIELNSGDRFGFVLVKDSTVDAARSGITPISSVLLSQPSTQKIEALGNGQYSLAWEDGQGNGTVDFNDLVIKVAATNQQEPDGAYNQGKLIDLSSVTGQVRAEFTLNREAAFNNFVGFYKVSDMNGGIDTDANSTTDLRPGDIIYAQAAIQGRMQGINLTVDNQASTTITTNLNGGSIYAPFIIADGKPDALLDSNYNNNSNIYFAFAGANPGKFDHIRLLGNNSWGFEDLPLGGDKDFNDVVVRAKFSRLGQQKKIQQFYYSKHLLIVPTQKQIAVEISSPPSIDFQSRSRQGR